MLILIAVFVVFCGMLGASHEGSQGRSAWAGFWEGAMGGAILLAWGACAGGAIVASVWAMEYLFGGGAC